MKLILLAMNPFAQLRRIPIPNPNITSVRTISCDGGYARLSSLARQFPILPNFHRSFVNNLLFAVGRVVSDPNDIHSRFLSTFGGMDVNMSFFPSLSHFLRRVTNET